MKSPEARKGMSHIRSDEEEENGDGSDASIGKQRQIKLEQKEVKMGRRKKLMVEEEETQEDDEITEGEKDEKRKNRFRVESHISPDLRSFIQISSSVKNPPIRISLEVGENGGNLHLLVFSIFGTIITPRCYESEDYMKLFLQFQYTPWTSPFFHAICKVPAEENFEMRIILSKKPSVFRSINWKNIRVARENQGAIFVLIFPRISEEYN